MGKKKTEKAGKKKTICKVACVLSVLLSAGILLVLWYALKGQQED